MDQQPQVRHLHVDPTTLTGAEWNPRRINDKEFDRLKASIQSDPTMLDAKPLIVSTREGKRTVIAGNMRLRAILALGITSTAIMEVEGLTLEQEQRWALKDNAHNGDWDWSTLANIDEPILLAVFTKVQLNEKLGINRDTEEDHFDVEGALDSIDNPIAQPGDLFEIGPHCILCGDSTNPEHFRRLMGDARANCIFTDPPYNVDYNYAKYDAIHANTRKRKFKDGGKIFNDNKTPADFQEFLRKVFEQCYIYTTDDCPIYVCHATKTQDQFFGGFRGAGWHFSQTIIWLKERIILAMGQDYHRVYEPIIYGWKEGKKHYANRFMTTESEVWDLDKKKFEECLDLWYAHRDKSSEYEHPTQKPVRLAGLALRKSCPPGGLVLEPFMGSGSTMIAAHQTERTCYGIELDPAYVDVEIRRLLRAAPELTVKRNGQEIDKTPWVG